MKVKHVYPSCFVSGFPLVTHDGRERGRVGMADPVERKESSDRTDRDKMESPQGILLFSLSTILNSSSEGRLSRLG